MGFDIGRLTRLPLGYQGENNSRTIQVCVSEWLAEWPNASVEVMVQRPGEDTFYPANTEVTNGVLTWIPNRSDVQYAGEGIAQFILTDDNDVELRSRVVKTIIEQSIHGTQGEPPAPGDSWVHDVFQAAEDAREAVDKMPIIGENGNWFVWDAESSEHVDSGVHAKGKGGEDGKAATVSIGTVTTLEPGSKATVSNSGTETDAVLNFGIPRGADATGGGGTGTVTSVNGVEPDGNGNVVIPIPSKPGDIGAEVSGTATAKVSAHNEDKQAHPDIRELISGKLDADRLPEAINTALEQAKDSGEFDGEPGDSGVHVGSEPPTGGQNVWIDPTGEPDGEVSGGVQPDWNQNDETAPDFIKNKPFGEVKGDTLSWEFDLSSLDLDNLPGGYFVKVSDVIVTMDDLVNGCTVTTDILGGALDIHADEIQEIATGIVCLPEMLAVFIDESGVGVDLDGIVFPESGVYVVAELLNGSITVPNYTDFIARKKMDETYLPDTVVKQTVLYVGMDDEGTNRIYKDAEYTEGLRQNELIDLMVKKHVLIIDYVFQTSCAVFVQSDGIAYVDGTIDSNSGEVSLKIAHAFLDE